MVVPSILTLNMKKLDILKSAITVFDERFKAKHISFYKLIKGFRHKIFLF